MPLVSQTFDQLLDFTRTSSATFVGSNGLVQTTAASRNLLTWTQQFDNAAWTKIGSTATANTTVAPDGTSTADRLLANAGTNIDVGTSVSNLSYVSGQSYTLSVFVKAGSYGFLQLAVLNYSNSWANFDLSTGTVGTVGGGTSSIQNVGDGWYRCSMTFTATATGSNGVIYALQAASASALKFAKWSPTGVETVFVWGAQLEAASAATTYTRNNGGVFPPRFDYDPVTLAAKGLLIEEQRTNLLTGSADFTTTYWPTATNVVVTADNTTSPDGTSNADRIADNTTAGAQHRLYRDYTFTAAAHTLSVYAKRNDHRWLRLFFFDGTTSFFANFDLLSGVTGAKQASATSTITNAGNGWYRCTMTATTAAAVGNVQLVMLPSDDAAVPVLYTGTGTSLWAYGAQLEAGAFATSYIPTVASQVTRTTDQCAIVAPNFAPWYNQSEGTFVVEAIAASGLRVGAQGLFSVNNGTTSNAMNAAREAGSRVVRFNGTGSPAGDVTSVNTALDSTLLKAASAYKLNDWALSLNGATAVTDTSAVVPTATRLGIGSLDGLFDPSAQWGGHIRSIRYYPVRLSNSQLQALTA